MRGRSVCADCGELDSPEDPCLCREGARTCRVDLIYEDTTPATALTKGEAMKPHSVYFTIDLTQRPPNESKRGVIYRAFATAAKDAVEAAMAESSLPDAVLVMVTLAPKPVLADKPEEAAP